MCGLVITLASPRFLSMPLISFIILYAPEVHHEGQHTATY